MLIPIKLIISFLSINAFFLDLALSVPVYETKVATSSLGDSTNLPHSYPFSRHFGNAKPKHQLETLLSKEEPAGPDDPLHHRQVKRGAGSPWEYANWNLGEKYWTTCQNRKHQYRPKVPDDYLTGSRLSDEDAKKLGDEWEQLEEEVNKLKEQGCVEPENKDEDESGKWHPYEYQYRKVGKQRIFDRIVLKGELIAAGGYGEVYEAYRQLPETGGLPDFAPSVMKSTLHTSGAGHILQGCLVQQEISGLTKHAVPVEGCYMEKLPGDGEKSKNEPRNATMVMPFQDRGDFIDNAKEFLAEKTTDKMVLQAVEGMQVMHKAGYMHRDLKPANILVGDNVARIGDFDMAIKVPEGGSTEFLVGTPGFLAPEIFLLQAYTELADVFSLAITWIFMSSRKLWHHADLVKFWRDLVTPRNGRKFLNPRDVEFLLNSWFVMDKERRQIAKYLVCGVRWRKTMAWFHTELAKLVH